MHKAVYDFIKEIKSEYPSKFRFKKVLEVGSRNVNGSPRKYFNFCTYTGIDIIDGKGVNLIRDINKECFPLKYNIVISTEMLEHNYQWDRALINMFDSLQVGGLMIITCAGPDRHEHGTESSKPEDSPGTTAYYKNITKNDFRSILPLHLFDPYILNYARGKNDLQFHGIKKITGYHTAKEIYSLLIKKQKHEKNAI